MPQIPQAQVGVASRVRPEEPKEVRKQLPSAYLAALARCVGDRRGVSVARGVRDGTGNGKGPAVAERRFWSQVCCFPSLRSGRCWKMGLLCVEGRGRRARKESGRMIPGRRDRHEVGERHLLWLRWCRASTRHRVIMIIRGVGTE